VTLLTLETVIGRHQVASIYNGCKKDQNTLWNSCLDRCYKRYRAGLDDLAANKNQEAGT
jgi:hypothetical protein